MPFRRRPRRLLALAPTAGSAIALVIVAAACGGSSGATNAEVASLGTTVSAAEATSTTAAASTQEALLAYAGCLREQGLDVADPTFDADGNAAGGLFGPDSGIDPRSEGFRAAQEACGDLIEGITLGGPGGRGGLDRDEIQTSLSDFTACLRDEGLDVEDIEFGAGRPDGGPDGSAPNGSAPSGSVPDGGFQGGAPPGDGDGPPEGFDPTARMIEQLGLDADDPAVATALETCQPILESAFQPDGTTTTP